MDAVKFVKEHLRMCTKFDACGDCPIYKTDFCTDPAEECSQESAEEIVELVEEWSAAHPRKTRQSVFLEHWPEAAIDSYGVLNLCPTPISKSHRNIYGKCAHAGVNCDKCRREFWMQEVE